MYEIDLNEILRLNETIDTQKDVNDFYAVDGNAINCLCSIVSTVVNEKGEALAKNLIAKMQKQEEAWIAAGGGVK